MCPDVGRSRPPRRWSSVDLPEPDLPSRATFSPRRISSETPRSAQTRTDLPDAHSLVTSHNRTAKGDRTSFRGAKGDILRRLSLRERTPFRGAKGNIYVARLHSRCTPHFHDLGVPLRGKRTLHANSDRNPSTALGAEWQPTG